MSTVRRYDFGRLAKSKPIAGGGAAVPARLTRTGVFTYRRSDGGERRELRLPEEVFHKDSLATLPYAPVTLGHPTGAVNSANWKKHAIGSVSAKVTHDSTYVESDLIVQDSKGLAGLDSGDIQETSCGYTCALEMKSGVHKGERYDAIQRNIRYNHVALGPEGWGRAGSEVHIKLDSGDAIAIDSKEREIPMLTYTIDGISFDVSSEQFIQALDKNQAKWKLDTATLESERDSEKGRADGLQLKVTELETKKDSNSEDFEQKVQALVTIRTDALTVLGKDFDFSGKSGLDIMKAVILKKDDKTDLENKSDDYVKGLYEASKKTVKKDSKEPNKDHKKISDILTLNDEDESDRKDASPEYPAGMAPLSVSKDRS